MAVASLALFISLGGTAYAAVMVYSSNIVDNTIQSRDIKDGANGVKSRDVRDNSLGLIDISAAAETYLRSPGTIPSVDAESSGIPVANATTVFGIQLNLERHDIASMHAPGSGRLYAPIAGKYLVTAHVSWIANGGAGQRYARIEKRDSTNAVLVSFFGSSTIGSTTFETSNDTSLVTSMQAGDYVQINVYQSSGASADAYPQMTAVWVAP